MLADRLLGETRRWCRAKAEDPIGEDVECCGERGTPVGRCGQESCTVHVATGQRGGDLQRRNQYLTLSGVHIECLARILERSRRECGGSVVAMIMLCARVVGWLAGVVSTGTR